jgi:hypothetical protein
MKLGFCSIIFIVLLVLKLCALVTISWWWVFCPLIIMSVFWFLVCIVGILVGVRVIIKEISK